MASLGVSLGGRSSGQGDSVGLELSHCVSKGTLSELDLAHVCKCALGRQQDTCSNSSMDINEQGGPVVPSSENFVGCGLPEMVPST